MAHAETCPVCKGSGLVYPEKGRKIDDVTVAQTCHGCNGKGWVEVGDTIPAFPSPVIPAPIPNSWPWQPDPYAPRWPWQGPYVTWRYQHEVGL